MGIMFEINTMEEMCDLMCDNRIPVRRKRKGERKDKDVHTDSIRSGSDDRDGNSDGDNGDVSRFEEIADE